MPAEMSGGAAVVPSAALSLCLPLPNCSGEGTSLASPPFARNSRIDYRQINLLITNLCTSVQRMSLGLDPQFLPANKLQVSNAHLAQRRLCLCVTPTHTVSDNYIPVSFGSPHPPHISHGF